MGHPHPPGRVVRTGEGRASSQLTQEDREAVLGNGEKAREFLLPENRGFSGHIGEVGAGQTLKAGKGWNEGDGQLTTIVREGNGA